MFYVIFLPVVIQVDMNEHGGGIPLGHYKSKSVSRINFLEKWERGQREFITTVEGVAEFSWLAAIHFTVWALPWRWLAIVHRQKCFGFFSILVQHSWNCKCNFSCKTHEYSAIHFYVEYSPLCHNQKEKLLLHINNWLTECPNLPSSFQRADQELMSVVMKWNCFRLHKWSRLTLLFGITKSFVETDSLYQNDPASFKLFYIRFGLKFKIETGCLHLPMTQQYLRFRVSSPKVSSEECNSWMVR